MNAPSFENVGSKREQRPTQSDAESRVADILLVRMKSALLVTCSETLHKHLFVFPCTGNLSRSPCSFCRNPTTYLLLYRNWTQTFKNLITLLKSLAVGMSLPSKMILIFASVNKNRNLHLRLHRALPLSRRHIQRRLVVMVDLVTLHVYECLSSLRTFLELIVSFERGFWNANCWIGHPHTPAVLLDFVDVVIRLFCVGFDFRM